VASRSIASNATKKGVRRTGGSSAVEVDGYAHDRALRIARQRDVTWSIRPELRRRDSELSTPVGGIPAGLVIVSQPWCTRSIVCGSMDRPAGRARRQRGSMSAAAGRDL